MRGWIWVIVAVCGVTISGGRFALFQKRELEWKPPAKYELGDVVLVPDLTNVRSVWLAGRPMTRLPQRRGWIGVAPYNSAGLVLWLNREPKSYTWPYAEFSVPVVARELETAADLRIPASIWKTIDDSQEAQKEKDRETMRQVLRTFSGNFSPTCWRTPVKSVVTSRFGNPRRLNDGTTYHHLGEDRRASVGTPIYAIGCGRIAYAGEMILPGRNVVVAHGEGWFSRYLHFSEIKVKENTVVKAGDLLGLSGATGRVDAPHLHWEILWRGIHADPSRFLPEWERLCDRG